MESSPIYRIPRYTVGSEVYMAHEVQDKLPWGLRTRKVEPHWAKTRGKGVTVAVLDTGLWKHKDLPEPAFVANFSSSRSVYDAAGHGTHVAGTIGARMDGAGVVGWAPECNIGCVKVLGDDGSGSSQSIARGIHYAATQGAKIINMSLGGGYSPEIERAVNEVVKAGVFVICAAGNEGDGNGNNTIGWPARLDTTVAIASYREDGRISDFSSRGPEVDMAFPGEDVLSTWLNNTFRSISGTSMATPAAAGLTALMLSNPAGVKVTNNQELLAHWKKHAVDAGKDGFDIAFGWGIPDVDGILRDTATTPIPDGNGSGGGLLDLIPAINIGGFRVKPMTYDGVSGLFIGFQNQK